MPAALAHSPSFAQRWKAWRLGLLVAATTGIVWLLCFQHPVVWVIVGIGEPDRPFLDLHALLAGCDAIRLGLDPLQPNALDPYHRPFGFSSWWFELARLGLGLKDLIWLGAALLGTSLLTAIAMVRPANWRQALVLWLLLISPATLLAVNRANQDLVVFVIVSLGLACFRGTSGVARALGVVFLAAAAVLKYFPLVTAIMLFDFRTRRALIAGLGLYGLVLLLAWPGLEPALRMMGKYALTSEWLYAFGAPVLARDFHFSGPAYWLVPAAGLAIWAIWRASRSPADGRTGLPVSHDAHEREFICGAVMLLGIFFLGVSYLYKLIFAFWLLPWLWAQLADGSGKRAARFLLGLVLGLAWGEGVAAVILNLLGDAISPATALAILKVVLVVSQLATWVLVGCLLRYVCAYFFRCYRAFVAATPSGT